MNQTKIKECALSLEHLLLKYSETDDDAAGLLGALEPLISRAKSEQIDQPLSWSKIPGAYYFQERNLQQYKDLEHSYSEFCIELIGGETPFLKELRKEMEKGDN